MRGKSCSNELPRQLRELMRFSCGNRGRMRCRGMGWSRNVPGCFFLFSFFFSLNPCLIFHAAARRAPCNQANRCKGNLERGAAQTVASKPSSPDGFGARIPWGIRAGGNAPPTPRLSSGGRDRLRGGQRCPLHAGFQPGRKMRQKSARSVCRR